MADVSQVKKNISLHQENQKMGLVIASIKGQAPESRDSHVPSYCDTSAKDFLSIRNDDWYERN